MKLGCILKTFALVIVLIGIALYIFKKHGNEIIDSGKEKLEIFLAERFQNSIDEMKESVLKDSLQEGLNNLINEIELKDIQLSNEDYIRIVQKLDELIDSTKISQKNFEILKEYINKYEESEKK